jgi:hypothetical protein
MAQGINIGMNGDTTICRSASEKIGLYGVTPVVQASAITSAVTTGATADIAGAQTAINSILTALRNIGIVASA